MLSSRGAINGARVNDYEIDGGRFYFDDIGGRAGVAFNLRATLSQAITLGGKSTITFSGILNFTLPIQLAGTAVVRVNPTLRLSRGQHIEGTSLIAIATRLELSRKAALLARSVIDVVPSLELERSFISTWDTRRRIIVPYGFRSMSVTPEPRGFLLTPDGDALERQRDRVIE